MSLVEIECFNPECPGYELHEDGTSTGQKFLGSEVPASRTDPGYIEGMCPKCGSDSMEWNVETLGPEDIEYLRCEHMSDRI